MRSSLSKKLFGICLVWAFIGPLLSAQATVSDDPTIIILGKSVHFIGADGSDALAQPGEYSVEAAEEWLKLIPGHERQNALLIEVEKGTHEEDVPEPVALSIAGDEELPDTHVVSLLLPGGETLEATGTYSGIRDRGFFKNLFNKHKKRIIKKYTKKYRKKLRKNPRLAKRLRRDPKLRSRLIRKEVSKNAKKEIKEIPKHIKEETAHQTKILTCKSTIAAMKAGTAAADFMTKLVPTATNKQKSMQHKLTNDAAFRDNIAKKIAQGLNANQKAIPELKRIQSWMDNPRNKAKLEAIFSTNNFCEDPISTMDAQLRKLGLAPNFAVIRSRGSEAPHFYMGYQITLDAGLGVGILVGLYGVTDFKGNGGKYWFLGAQGGIVAGGGVSAQVMLFPKVDLASFKGSGWGVGGSLGAVGTVNADVVFDEKFKNFQGFGIGGGAGVGPAKMFGDIAVSWDYSWKY